MGICVCIECKQPITREMAFETKAGGFTNGRCYGHRLGASMEPNLEPDEQEQSIETEGEPIQESTIAPATVVAEPEGDQPEQLAKETED